MSFFMLRPEGVPDPPYMLQFKQALWRYVSQRSNYLVEILAQCYVCENEGFPRENQTELFLGSFPLEFMLTWKPETWKHQYQSKKEPRKWKGIRATAQSPNPSDSNVFGKRFFSWVLPLVEREMKACRITAGPWSRTAGSRMHDWRGHHPSNKNPGILRK